MSDAVVIIDLIRRFPRDDFFLGNNRLRLELVKYLSDTCRSLLPGAWLELHADSTPRMEGALVDRVVRPQRHDVSAEDWMAHTLKYMDKGGGGVLFLSPLRGPATANRVKDLLDQSQSPGLYLSAVPLSPNRHPCWQLGTRHTDKTGVVSRLSKTFTGAKQNIPDHLRPHLPHPRDIRGSQFLPPMLEADLAVALARGGIKALGRAPQLVRTEPDLTGAPFAYRLPVFNIDQSIPTCRHEA